MGDFQVEVDSIRATVAWMQGNVIDTATKLRTTMEALNGYAVSSDWSGVPSCVAFGASYNAAIEAYTSVAHDLLKDATDMSKALSDIADEYDEADAGARARFDAAIAKFADAGYMTQTPATQTYAENKGDLHSDDAEQAPTQDGDAASTSTQPTAPAPGTTGNGRVRME